MKKFTDAELYLVNESAQSIYPHGAPQNPCNQGMKTLLQNVYGLMWIVNNILDGDMSTKTLTYKLRNTIQDLLYVVGKVAPEAPYQLRMSGDRIVEPLLKIPQEAFKSE